MFDRYPVDTVSLDVDEEGTVRFPRQRLAVSAVAGQTVSRHTGAREAVRHGVVTQVTAYRRIIRALVYV